MTVLNPGRHLWVGCVGTELDATTREHLDELRPGGVVLFGRNIESAAQVRRLIAELRSLLGEHLWLAVDQEGGRVVRFAREVTVFPGNGALGAVARKDLEQATAWAFEQGVVAAQELRALGIDVNFAPVADLSRVPENPSVGDRSFGSDPAIVSTLVRAFVDGHLQGGVLPTLKHFPGLGDAVVDSHLELPIVATGPDEATLDPFRAGIESGCPLVMTTHTQFDGLSGLPATFSRQVVEELLRDRLAYRGCVVTDAIEMGALGCHYSIEDAAQRAVGAGHDVLCVGTPDREFQRRTRDSLRDFFASDSGDAIGRASSARLDALERPMQQSIEANATDLAQRIAERAITVLRDPERLLPLDAAPFLALPSWRARTAAEDEPAAPGDRLRGESFEELRSRAPSGVVTMDYDADVGPEVLGALARQVVDSSTLVVALLDLRFLEGQQRMALQALQWHERVIFVLLGDEHDAACLPRSAQNATVICTHGFRAVHQQALAGIFWRGE